MRNIMKRRIVIPVAFLLVIVLVGTGFKGCATSTAYRTAATTADRMSRTLNSAVRATYAAESAGLIGHDRVLKLDPIYADAAAGLKTFINFGKGFSEGTYTEEIRAEAQTKFRAVTEQLDKIDASGLPADVKSQLDSVNSDRKQIEGLLNKEVKP